MKHIIQFSGGLASAYVAYMISEEFGKTNCILLNHNTHVEHPDTAEFKNDVCNFLGMDVIEVSKGLDLWDLIVKQKCLPSLWIPFCTRILKQEQGLKFIKTLKEKFILYNGFGVHEGHRLSGSIKACSAKGITVKSPLQEQNISDLRVMEIIRDEWRIKIPALYGQGFEHNNCIPCFKGGKEHFKRVCQYYPESFEKAIWAEEKIDNTVFKLSRKTDPKFTKNKVIHKYTKTGEERWIILTPLKELQKIWSEQPAKPKTVTFKHSDDWQQLDMFEIQEEELNGVMI